jgi:hypothetical protein
MKTTGPIHSNVTFPTIKSSGAFHATAGAYTTEFKKSVEDWCIAAYVELVLLADVIVHIIWRHNFQEFDVFVSVELCHF